MAEIAWAQKEKRKRPPAKEIAIVPTYNTDRGLVIKPNVIKNALDNLDAGSCADAAALFESMEDKYLHLGAVMHTRGAGVLSCEMTIAAGSESDHDKKIAKEIGAIFWKIKNIHGSLTDLLTTALGFGSALAEIYWKPGLPATIEKIETKDPRWLTFYNHADPTRLLDYPRWITLDDPMGIELDPRRFIYFAPLAGRRHAVRAGLYRGCIWYWLFSNFTLKDWMAFNELWGTPMRLGKLSANASDEEREALKKAVMNLGTDAAAVIDEGSTIEIIQAAMRGTSLYDKTLEYFNRQISKRILGQTLTTEGGGDSGGAYALGKVHAEVKADIKLADALKLEEVITRDVLKLLTDFNFGPQENYPTFKIQTGDLPDTGVTLDNAIKADELGFDTDEVWLEEQTGMPLTRKETVDANDAPKPKTDDEKTEALKNAIANPDAAIHPAQIKADKLFDSYIAHGHAAHQKLSAAVANAMRDDAQGGELTDAELKKTGFVDAILNVTLTAAIAGEATVLAEVADELAADKIENSVMLNAAEPYMTLKATPENVLTPEQAALWWKQKLAMPASEFTMLSNRHKKTAFAIARLENRRVTERIRDLFEKALTEEKSELLTFPKWRKAAEKAAIEEGLGASPFLSRAHAETIFRNNLYSAFSAQRYSALNKPFTKKVFPYRRLSIVDDGGTSDICKSLMRAKVVLPADDPYWNSHWPPFHHRCRTIVVGVSRRQANKGKIKISAKAPTGIEYDKSFLGAPEFGASSIFD